MCMIVLMKVHFCIVKVHTDYGSLDSSAVPGTLKSTVVASEQVLTYTGTSVIAWKFRKKIYFL